MSKTFYQFYGYDIEIQVGSQVLTTMLGPKQYGLCDQLTVSAQENTARTAKFTFIPPEGIVNLNNYQGLPVRILFRDSVGYYQVFYGAVDIPSFDFLARKITLSCTDQRANRIIQMPLSFVQQIGNYDVNVFGTVNDQNEEVEKRLQTVPASFDFDSYGNPTLTSWTPTVTEHFLFSSNDIKQDSNPSVTPSPRKETLNTVNFTVNYSYQRLHQQCVNLSWPGFQDFVTDYWNAGRPTFPTIDQVVQAATNSNWVFVNPTNSVNFVPLWPAGGYQAGGSVIIWQPNTVVNQYKQKSEFNGYLKDSTGNFVTIGTPARLVPQYKPVFDVNGNAVMETVSSTVIDTASALCRGASLNCALRFSQNVTESYSVTVQAPQSITKYGVVNAKNTIEINDPYDTNRWENSKSVTNTISNFFIDYKPSFNSLQNTLYTAYNKARHDILQVHRDTTVTFQTKLLQPRVDLKHTVRLNVEDPMSTTAHINAKGKVKSINHIIDFAKETAYTEISLLLSKSDGSETNSGVVFNAPLQNPAYIGVPQTIVLGTHLGEDVNTTVGADKWNGWIANKTVRSNVNQDLVRTTYPESFVIDFPEIPETLRGDLTYNSITALNIAIPDDDLETST